MCKKVLFLSVLVCLVSLFAVSAWAAEQVVLEYLSLQPEYVSQETEILKLSSMIIRKGS